MAPRRPCIDCGNLLAPSAPNRRVMNGSTLHARLLERGVVVTEDSVICTSCYNRSRCVDNNVFRTQSTQRYCIICKNPAGRARIPKTIKDHVFALTGIVIGEDTRICVDHMDGNRTALEPAALRQLCNSSLLPMNGVANALPYASHSLLFLMLICLDVSVLHICLQKLCKSL